MELFLTHLLPHLGRFWLVLVANWRANALESQHLGTECESIVRKIFCQKIILVGASWGMFLELNHKPHFVIDTHNMWITLNNNKNLEALMIIKCISKTVSQCLSTAAIVTSVNWHSTKSILFCVPPLEAATSLDCIKVLCSVGLARALPCFGAWPWLMTRSFLLEGNFGFLLLFSDLKRLDC